MSSKPAKCPFFGKPCIEHECVMWSHLEMINPHNGAAEDKWECSIRLIPIMIMDNARRTGGVQSAVETMRNDVCTRQDVFNQLALDAKEGRKAITNGG